MRKTIYKAIIEILINFFFSLLIYLFSNSKLWSEIFFLVIFLFILIEPALKILNKLTQRTKWFNAKWEDCLKFRKNIPRELDICNLGSSSAKYAFDYSDTGLKGANWALAPQTLDYDFRILKNYFSYLKKGATVLIPLCPFSGCIKNFENEKNNYKYYSFLHPVLILNYSPKTRRKAIRFFDKPFQVSPIKSLYRIFHDIPVETEKALEIKSLETNAQNFLCSWKKQFSITDLDYPLTEDVKSSIEFNSDILEKIVDFCIERDLKPVLVVPPITNILFSKFPKTFQEKYVFPILKKINLNNVLFLNYLEDERFSNLCFFSNSFYLSQRGRKKFTHQVLLDIGLIKKQKSLSKSGS